MTLRLLSKGLTYRGSAEGKRQTYYVLEGVNYFLVLSHSLSKKNSGNFNIVEASAVTYVASKFAGKQVTSKHVAKGLHKPQYVSSPLEALNVLYVMVATGLAKIDGRFKKSRQLHFNLKS